MTTENIAPEPETVEQAAAAGLTSDTDQSAPSPDELSEARAEATRLKDQLLRTAADFDNFRKRSRRELSDAERKGRDDFLKELLPVFDNLERATQLSVGTAEGEVRALIDGLGLVLRQFADTLGKLGVERVGTVGLPFDPSMHEAIQHLETNDYNPGTVAAEVQSGYRQGERLIRPALVVVAKAKTQSDSNPDASS